MRRDKNRDQQGDDALPSTDLFEPIFTSPSSNTPTLEFQPMHSEQPGKSQTILGGIRHRPQTTTTPEESEARLESHELEDLREEGQPINHNKLTLHIHKTLPTSPPDLHTHHHEQPLGLHVHT